MFETDSIKEVILKTIKVLEADKNAFENIEVQKTQIFINSSIFSNSIKENN